jgi:uncharacterized protein
MDVKERVIRDFYAARGLRDWDTVRTLLAEDVVWSEGGEQDYSGDHHGRDTVTALLEKYVEITDGTFSLEPTGFIVTADHVATNARWHAERRGRHVEGNDLAVFRLADGRIAHAWFFADGFEPDALGEVFSFGGAE